MMITLVATTIDTYAHVSNFEVKVEGELFCVEEVLSENDRTSRSVARIQVPRHKSDI